MRLPIEAPLQEEGGAFTDTDTPSSSTGPPPSRRQRPLREVLANGTTSMQPDSAASLSGSDQEQSLDTVHRPASATGVLSHLLHGPVVFVQSTGYMPESGYCMSLVALSQSSAIIVFRLFALQS